MVRKIGGFADTTQGARVAIITGAGTGIGAATARSLGRAGIRIVLVGRRGSKIAEVAEQVAADGGEALEVTGDVRDYADHERIIATTIEQFGRVDVLVLNAAIADYGPIHEADPNLWRDVITTNVLGVMFGCRAILPVMYEQGFGQIIIVASGSGRSTYVGEPAYITSKHATVAFADCLRKEITPRGLRVSLIEPGLVETPLIHVWPGADDLVEGVTPLTPEDVARTIAFVIDQPASCNVFEISLRPTSQL